MLDFFIRDKKKKELFLSLFHVLKSTTTLLHLTFSEETMHIQGMDKSHVCLFDLHLAKGWFDSYKVEQQPISICFDANTFYSMINTKGEDQFVSIKMNSSDCLIIELLNTIGPATNDYNKFFSLPLVEYDYEELNIPSTEYDAELSLPAKKLTSLLSQLGNFGNDVTVICTDDDVDFVTKGPAGDMRVRVNIDDMSSYSVVEGQTLSVTYSLFYITKMCLTSKLSAEIELSLSSEYPMKIRYDLGEESVLSFYIAPKISDEN
jgi:proliferating cell nuclear antigen